VGLLAEARVPAVVHAGHAPVGTGNTGPGPFGALMKRYPDLTAIVAHPYARQLAGLGLGDDWLRKGVPGQSGRAVRADAVSRGGRLAAR
jgi:hypothetical protein